MLLIIGKELNKIAYQVNTEAEKKECRVSLAEYFGITHLYNFMIQFI